MLCKLFVALGLAGPLFLFPVATAAEPLAPASEWVPGDAIAVLEISRPKPLLDLGTRPELIQSVTALPPYQQMATETKFREFLLGISFLEARFGLKWPEALHKLFDGGVLLSLHPNNGVLLIVDAQDKDLLDQAHDLVAAIVKGEAKKAGRVEQVASKDCQGVTTWTFGGDEAHAIIGNRLSIANRSELLKAVLDLRASSGGASLAAVPAYQAARRNCGAASLGLAFVNMEVIGQLPQVQEALKNDNPLATLLFAAVTEALRRADWLGMGIELKEDVLSFKATASVKDGDASSVAAFSIPAEAHEGALPNLAVPGQIAGLSFYRDLRDFYAAKDRLFPERTSGLIFFENMMGIFFSGRDLTDEVLGETRPEIRLVVAEPRYDPAVGTPRIQLPAFGSVFRLRHPEKAALIAEEAWQKAVGLVNITQGQKAQAGLIFDRVDHQDVRFTVAYFPVGEEKDKSDLDIRFNFRPALAYVGEYLVVASTEGLARDLIDALKKEMTGSLEAIAKTHSTIEVDAARLASLLQTNRDSLVRQNMVEQGKTEQQASAEFDFFLAVMRCLGRTRLDVATYEGRQQANLEVHLNLP